MVAELAGSFFPPQAGVEHKIEIKHQTAMQTLGRYSGCHVEVDFGIEFVVLVPKMS